MKDLSPIVNILGDTLTVNPDIRTNGHNCEEITRKRVELLMQSAWSGLFTHFQTNQLHELVNDATARRLWVTYMNSKRAEGNFRLSEKGFETLVVVFGMILTTCEEKNDGNTIRNCIMLSQTFHRLISGVKEFLYTRLLKHSIWKKQGLWEYLVNMSIETELEKSMEYGGNLTETDRLNVVFTQLSSYVHAMSLLGVTQYEIRQLVEKFQWEHNLNPLDLEALLDLSSENSSVSAPPTVLSRCQSIKSRSDTEGDDSDYQCLESRSQTAIGIDPL